LAILPSNRFSESGARFSATTKAIWKIIETINVMPLRVFNLVAMDLDGQIHAEIIDQ
jgi:hypothetical protein